MQHSKSNLCRKYNGNTRPETPLTKMNQSKVLGGDANPTEAALNQSATMTPSEKPEERRLRFSLYSDSSTSDSDSNTSDSEESSRKSDDGSNETVPIDIFLEGDSTPGGAGLYRCETVQNVQSSCFVPDLKHTQLTNIQVFQHEQHTSYYLTHCYCEEMCRCVRFRRVYRGTRWGLLKGWSN